MCDWFPEESCSDELPVSSLDFEKNQGVMSACNVEGGLVFYFLEMVEGKAVLFLETGQIKGYLEKLKIFIFQPVSLTIVIGMPFSFSFSKGVSLICPIRIALYLANV